MILKNKNIPAEKSPDKNNFPVIPLNTRKEFKEWLEKEEEFHD
jgi:hypothetical protein